MGKYQIDASDPLWEAWKDTVPRSQRLDERLKEHMARDIREHNDSLDPEVRDEVNRLLGGERVDGA